MGAEFFVKSQDKNWYSENQNNLIKKLSELKTFIPKDIIDNEFWTFEGNEFWLQGFEERGNKNRWKYDVRLFFSEDDILLEISMRPKTIENDLSNYLTWIRSQTNISVNDEDGEPSGW